MQWQRMLSDRAKVARNTEIVARAAAGETPATLARAYGLSRIRIKQILSAYPNLTSAIETNTAQIGPATEVASLPVAGRLRRACEELGIITLAELAGALSELEHLPNLGHRTRLETRELLHQAGLREVGAPTIHPPPTTAQPPQNESKRSMLRERLKAGNHKRDLPGA